MATLRQIAANQKNAQHSTGPVTDAGKEASRRNALKHGLAGDGVVLSDADQDAVKIRMVEWRPNYQPQTAEQEWFFEQLVTLSIRLDRCHEQEAHLHSSESHRAALCWDEDRQAEVEEIATKLSKRPALISKRLQRTRHGVEWMIGRWQTLSLLFERNGEWTEAQTALAHDLLGTPLELRDDEPFRDPAAMASHQIEILNSRLVSSLNALDEFERNAAIAGAPITLSKAMSNLRRYEAACQRHYQKALDQLRESLQANPPIEPTYTPPPVTTPTTNQTRWDSGQDNEYSAIPESDRMPAMLRPAHFDAFHPQS